MLDFTQRIDMWDDAGESIIEHLAGIEDDFALRLVASSASACHPASLIFTRASFHHLPGAWVTTC
jgi:hypothetical protein